MSKRKILPIIISIVIPLAVGGLAGFLTMNSMGFYETINKPPLAPPGFLFPIVWGILYTLMGISSYLVWREHSAESRMALYIYAVQLVLNFVWPLLFFNGRMFLLSFVWLLALLAIVIFMTVRFYNINKVAGLLQIPYILWLIFASYLNFAIFLIN